MKIDYEALGFKAGLEVHHQLDTERKLFCRCPVKLTRRHHDAELLRHMRPTLSELGEYDGTALMEFKTRKNVIYQIYNDMNCTYEMDDTPPFLVNDQALDISIAIARTFGMSLVDEVHITRKQYLDGSIPTGFQRTAIIGVGGGFRMQDRDIGILHMSLEEDSCREVSDVGHQIVFKADRLGFPLVEVVTAPDFRTPVEAGVGAEAIRRALWNLRKVRRGPGSVRHDVNCSITGGTRIEIKGVPRIADIPHLLHNEALRQKSLLEIRDTLRIRGITEKVITRQTRDVTDKLRCVRGGGLPWDTADQVIAIKLKGFGGLLTRPTQEHAVFAGEFAGRIRVIACLDSVPNLLYPESPEGEELGDGIWHDIYRLIEATHHDAVLLVFGPREDVETAVSEIYIRAREATLGVPPETRQALKNGSNDFERILPGPDRMYPDTDHPPVPLTDERVQAILVDLPTAPWIREDRYHAAGLPEDEIRTLAISPSAPLFDALCVEFPGHEKALGEVFGRILPGMARKGIPVIDLHDEQIRGVMRLLVERRLYREGLTTVLAVLSRNPDLSAEDACRTVGLTPVPDNRVTDLVEEAVQLPLAKPFPSAEGRYRWIMGRVMNGIRGRIQGSIVAALVRQRLETP
ncbi:Glu-tRNA(Gln) amidotransferase subunit GatE [bacterium]|nr:Glu-tRNA(Gln) amidotransferase subunit GatE [candidate division CSSED10-310 bacterium]